MKISSPRWLTLFCVVMITAFSVSASAEPTADVHAESEVNPKPELKKPVKIRFPSALRKKITTGEIVIQFIVTKTGTVTDPSVVKFSDADLVEPVLAAYAAAQYNPGLLKGVPVDVKMEVTVPYPLK
jgi:TonB family protein